MVGNGQTTQARWRDALEPVLGLDLRSLAAFRIGLALVLLADLWMRSPDLVAHYTDAGVMPRALLQEIAKPWHWSLHALSGQLWLQIVLFGLAAFLALMLLVGHRTRFATIASWILLISLHNRNPVLIFAADDVLRALLFWAMFLPLGACYSIDSALNTSTRKLPERIASVATVALMLQQCFIYIFSAAFKTKSDLWGEGTAVYYALSFDQYVTPFGQFLLNFPALLVILTYVTLVLEWVGPLAIFVPFRNDGFRLGAVIAFISLHIGFGLTFNLGIFPFLSSFSWLAFLPSSFWNGLQKWLETPERQGLKIYYDAECGFCKKVVHLLRTFLILPGSTPLQMAQDEPDIYADMQAYNSWVIVDWQGNRRFKFQGIIYVVSLSPILKWLVPVLSWKPIMSLGTRFYETIASNRRAAGTFTRPFKFRPLTVKPSQWVNMIALLLLVYTLLWNVSSYAPEPFKRRTWQRLEFIGRTTRLDQSWSIFAPAPPRDDGWHVIPGQLADGTEVDVLQAAPVSWEKPTLGDRSNLYRNMQWRTYFINLNRSIGQKLYPVYGQYLCRHWNAHHPSSHQLKRFEIYFMDERTVPPGEVQPVTPEQVRQQAC